MGDVGGIIKNGKCLLLAYDQGFEHGPEDFNETNVDPEYIVKIAQEAGVYTGIVFQAGVAERYYTAGPGMPLLLVKLNGKTSFHKGEEPLSLQLCSVATAKEMGAVAVGYTIYVGSEHEEVMMQEFRKIVEESHELGMQVVAWMYPRGKHVEGKESSKEVVAYAARLGMELGADVVKLPYTGDTESYKWVVKNAGRTKVVVQGGSKKSPEDFLQEISDIMKAGAAGMAIGRNIWQGENPVELSRKISQLVFSS